MSQYYFVVASLPFLPYETDKFPASGTFLQFCKEQLTQIDYKLLKSAVEEHFLSETKCDCLNRYRRWEISLRNELVRLRAQERGEEHENYIRQYKGSDLLEVQEIARNAFSQDSPLTAEDILNRARWDYMDQLEMGHYFNIEKLIIYYLRLQLLERKALFNREQGTARFQEIYREIIREESEPYLNKESAQRA